MDSIDQNIARLKAILSHEFDPLKRAEIERFIFAWELVKKEISHVEASPKNRHIP